MADPFYGVRKFLSNIFMVPAFWFKSPIFITNLIIPVILAAWFFHELMTRKLKIFKRSPGASWVISIILGFFALPMIVPNPSFAYFMSTMGIMILRGHKITGRRLLFSIIVGGISWRLSIAANEWITSIS